MKNVIFRLLCVLPLPVLVLAAYLSGKDASDINMSVDTSTLMDKVESFLPDESENSSVTGTTEQE